MDASPALIALHLERNKNVHRSVRGTLGLYRGTGGEVTDGD